MQKTKEEKLAELVKTFEHGMPFDDPTKMGEYYDTIDPEIYDELIVAINFTTETHAIATAALEKLAVLDANIIDVGCGTGLMGKLLGNKGYKNIVGIDASQKFVDASIATGFYKEAEAMYLGNGDLPEKYVNHFDMAVASGVWLKGHIPCAGIEDVYLSLKVGGLFVTAMRAQYW